MATPDEVDALVEDRLTQMDTIATDAIDDAQDFLDTMAGNMPTDVTYNLSADLPLDIAIPEIEDKKSSITRSLLVSVSPKIISNNSPSPCPCLKYDCPPKVAFPIMP